MSDRRIYSEVEAERILNAFPPDKLDELLKLARHAKDNPEIIRNHESIPLPAGWAYGLYANCIIARYQDGEQERKAFFMPQIWIEFQNSDIITAKKSIGKRLALGYCSCGKSMPLIKVLLWATDLIEHKWFLSPFSKTLGYTVGAFIGLWILVRPIHKYSLIFNRHPDCL